MKFLAVTFVFKLRLSFLIGFNYFSFNFGAFLKFWEIQKSKVMDPIWPPFGNYDVLTASYDVIAFRCRPQGKIFGGTVHPPGLIVVAFIVTTL